MDIAKHYAWRQRVAQRMPETAMRVFALRGKLYPGCGFHYALEKKLGAVMRFVNDFDEPIKLTAALVEPIIVEELFRDIAAAERS